MNCIDCGDSMTKIFTEVEDIHKHRSWWGGWLCSCQKSEWDHDNGRESQEIIIRTLTSSDGVAVDSIFNN